jgi:predicted O-methyltransferase YrrM
MRPQLDILLTHPSLAVQVARNPFRYLGKPAHELPPRFHLAHTDLCLRRSAERFRQLDPWLAQPDLSQVLDRELSRFCGRKGALYLLTRLFRPAVVVETGVWFGFTSAQILRALADNREDGALYSIDKPEHPYDLADGSPFRELLPEACPTGFVVPATLRDRWELRLGTARDLLPKLLDRLETIDMFFHDSEHSYENMTFEFHAAWDHLAPGGLLVADDVGWNGALHDFCRKERVQPAVVKAGMAVCRKPV